MAKFVCEKHPSLSFAEPRGRDKKLVEWARFVDGVFETDDASDVARLRNEACQAKFGIREEVEAQVAPEEVEAQAAPSDDK